MNIKKILISISNGLLNTIKRLSIFVAERMEIAMDNIKKQQSAEKQQSTSEYFKQVLQNANNQFNGSSNSSSNAAFNLQSNNSDSEYLSKVSKRAENKLFDTKW